MMTPLRSATFALAAGLLLAASAVAQTETATRPAVGDEAPTLSLVSTAGEPVDLAETFDEGKTVLVVLRGYPGYQCGICSKQATDFLRQSKKFADAEANVVMVYPGDAAGLDGHADEFLTGAMKDMKRKKLPKGVTMLLDPNFDLVDAYGLRWDAPNETAYPATYIVEDGKITFAEVSDGHGGRVNAKGALAALTK
ncbi:putative peroxiredoxin [Botrimarina colliarenosi]|uniref:Putative peroxiredoxin n=1 Tax=Botrimarina colliarenosi TaxID=2528001 RepID=A0A5C6AJJ8_9BACT|nr:redoxin family protein [Botrimarina colliarenosi]TWT99201.1 putative peroxiredoxin [Botrimarina colliarenosi]